MGAGANNSGNKSLNDRRERAAGRQQDRGPEREAIQDAGGVPTGKGRGRAGGAFGGASPKTDISDVNPSAKRAKKRS
jgi:hypothetical protein